MRQGDKSTFCGHLNLRSNIGQIPVSGFLEANEKMYVRRPVRFNNYRNFRSTPRILAVVQRHGYVVRYIRDDVERRNLQKHPLKYSVAIWMQTTSNTHSMFRPLEPRTTTT